MDFTLRFDGRLRLVLLSFLMLFVELALIRWLGSNVVYLAYFSNCVLLGSFLGSGVGVLRAKAGPNPLGPIGAPMVQPRIEIQPPGYDVNLP
jgi:hypothetical protein